jgi:hypothetical protein
MPRRSPFLIFVFVGVLSVAARAASAEPPAITPRERVALFNGRDLSSFTTWLAKLGTADPDRVFTVVDRIDGAPAIRISGQHYGGIITKDRYTDYRFVMEYRWGPVTWRPRAESTRDSGVLFHCQGEPGNNTPDFRAPWQRSIEYQIIEGGTGDLIIVGGYERGNPELLFPTLRATVTPGTRRWNPEGVEQEFGRGRNRTDWRLKDPAWKDVLGFRGANEAENVPGQWNLLEATCAGRSLTYYLNGIKVNAATDASLREGRILIQSEGAELYVRRVELLPLTP